MKSGRGKGGGRGKRKNTNTEDKNNNKVQRLEELVVEEKGEEIIIQTNERNENERYSLRRNDIPNYRNLADITSSINESDISSFSDSSLNNSEEYLQILRISTENTNNIQISN
jgi:hypothetical protein